MKDLLDGITRVLGRLFFWGDRIALDAEPHVMSRARNIFDKAQGLHERGKYTHSPLTFPKNMQSAKDLNWFRDRYPLEVEGEALEWILSASAKYDLMGKNRSSLGKDSVLKLHAGGLKHGVALRKHQVEFVNMAVSVGRMLLADKMGLGKTLSALGTLSAPGARPALIVVPTHLISQWEREVKRMYSEASVHAIRGAKNYELPICDVLVTSYGRLKPWEDVLCAMDFKTLIFDEVHELRHDGTAKRWVASILSEKAERCFGLSGTPIYNHGDEIWSVMDVLSPGCLGDQASFVREWCSWGVVNEPALLHNYLKEMGLFLRRTPEDIGLSFGEHSKHVYTLDADLESLQKVQDVARTLALSVLSAEVTESNESARELDWKLRHATGVAKARSAAEFAKQLCEQGEKVLLVGWHRDVYDIWLKELAQFNPVMFTGSETTREKDQSVKAFMDGKAQIFIISLRSGAGLDGLQRACNHVVFGELDWSPHVMDQIVARLDRDGQTKHVQAFYLTIADGADPFMMSVLGEKRSQHDGLVEGKGGSLEIKGAGDNDRIRAMAKAYLEKIGDTVPESNLNDNAKEIVNALKSFKVSFKSEDELQKAVYGALPTMLKDFQIEREVKISKRSRLDFLAVRNGERIAIECKIDAGDRANVYRQIRKYAKEGDIQRLILYAPWTGVKDFTVDGIPVNVVDFNVNLL